MADLVLTAGRVKTIAVTITVTVTITINTVITIPSARIRRSATILPVILRGR